MILGGKKLLYGKDESQISLSFSPVLCSPLLPVTLQNTIVFDLIFCRMGFISQSKISVFNVQGKKRVKTL